MVGLRVRSTLNRLPGHGEQQQKQTVEQRQKQEQEPAEKKGREKKGRRINLATFSFRFCLATHTNRNQLSFCWPNYFFVLCFNITLIIISPPLSSTFWYRIKWTSWICENPVLHREPSSNCYWLQQQRQQQSASLKLKLSAPFWAIIKACILRARLINIASILMAIRHATDLPTTPTTTTTFRFWFFSCLLL